MTAAQQRKALRVAHLIAAAALVGAVIFLPDVSLRYAVSLVVLAVLAVTGGAMWQAPRIRRLWKAISKSGDAQAHRPVQREEIWISKEDQ